MSLARDASFFDEPLVPGCDRCAAMPQALGTACPRLSGEDFECMARLQQCPPAMLNPRTVATLEQLEVSLWQLVFHHAMPVPSTRRRAESPLLIAIAEHEDSSRPGLVLSSPSEHLWAVASPQLL